MRRMAYEGRSSDDDAVVRYISTAHLGIRCAIGAKWCEGASRSLDLLQQSRSIGTTESRVYVRMLDGKESRS